MAEKYWKLKKSRVAGKIPTLNEIDLDTIVLNQVDAIAYIRKKGLNGDPDEVVAIAGGSIVELPEDVWRSSVASQIRVLEEEEALSDFDAFPFEDRTDSWKKKFIKWLHIKHNLTSWFYANNTSEQIKNTPEKQSLHDDDRFLIEDNEATPYAFVKKSLKWSTIKSAVIDALSSLYGLWSQDLYGIKTNQNVAIGRDAPTTRKFSVLTQSLEFAIHAQNEAQEESAVGVKGQATLGTGVVGESSEYVGVYGSGWRGVIGSGSNVGVEGISTDGNAGVFTSVSGNGVLGISTNAAGVAGNSIHYYGGSFTSTYGIGLYASSIVSAGDIEITNSSKGLILKSPNGTRYRVTVDNSGNLVTTAL